MGCASSSPAVASTPEPADGNAGAPGRRAGEVSCSKAADPAGIKASSIHAVNTSHQGVAPPVQPMGAAAGHPSQAPASAAAGGGAGVSPSGSPSAIAAVTLPGSPARQQSKGRPSPTAAAAPAVAVAAGSTSTDGRSAAASPKAGQPSAAAAAAAAAAAKKKGGGEANKARRAAAGSEAVREQIRRMVVGGPQTKEEKEKLVEVSDSEDEAITERAAAPRAGSGPAPDVAAKVGEALRRSFIFRGFPEDLLAETVGRMERVSFAAGDTILQQGALPTAADCMYYLESGQAEVVIFGAVDASKKDKDEDAQRRVSGNAVRISQGAGWVFGDVALLFNSPRTASVVAASDVVLWAMDRPTFLTLVMKHAQGARTLRFVRKVPLLKGLSDNDLLRVAGRMPERSYEDGQALIRYGERGDEMYLIRYGKVRVLVPDGKGGRLEVAVLGRGQFVGERSVINDRLRSADVIAAGAVQVVVLKKRDFLDLDNPLLAWMLDYDAVNAVLRSLPAFKRLRPDALEHILDRCDARQELYQGQAVLKQGDSVEKLYVVKMGDISLLKDGQPVSDPTWLREAGGFSFFGDVCLDAITRSPYTVNVKSEVAHVLSLPRRQLDSFLGAAGAGLSSRGEVLSALRRCKALAVLRDEDLAAIVDACDPVRYSPGEVVATASGAPCYGFFLVRAGEVLLLPPGAQLPAAADHTHSASEGPSEEDVERLKAQALGKLGSGDLYNEKVLSGPAGPLPAHLVAATPGTVVISLDLNSIQKALSKPGGLLQRQQEASAAQAGAGGAGSAAARAAGGAAGATGAAPAAASASVEVVGPSANRRNSPALKWGDLEFKRIIGTGQFGMVRVVRHIHNNQVYALKLMHKAPLQEAKQIEHVYNERRILGEAMHPFLVQMVGAYQDAHNLYLLQEWVPGGELFHHLDIEGSFTDDTAAFYAANVVLAMEFLHAKGIVYRDLKPENLLLDTKGYCKMADFGFAKKVGNDKTFTICGTPDYQAPEVIMRRGTNKAADYWALGVLIFEMLVGDPPFKSLTGDPWDTFRRTLSGRFYVPHFITEAAADLIFKLLQVNPEKRLGSGPTGIQEIKSHRWFARINWAALEARQVPAPIVPPLHNAMDTSHFDNFDDAEEELAAAAVAQSKGPAPCQDKQVSMWELWDWIEPGLPANHQQRHK